MMQLELDYNYLNSVNIKQKKSKNEDNMLVDNLYNPWEVRKN